MKERDGGWSKYYETLDSMKIMVGRYWFLASRERDKQRNTEHVRLSRWGEGWGHQFKINTPQQWKAVRDAIDRLVIRMGWEETIASEAKIVDQIAELDKYRRLTKRQRQQIDSLVSKLGELRSQKWASQVPAFRRDIAKFEEYLNRTPSEGKMQEWLERHIWVFGPQYLDGQLPRKEWPEARFDFLLQRYDTFYDVIELKKPDDELFVGSGKSPSTPLSPSDVLKKALSQIIDYLEKLNLYGPAKDYEGGVHVFKPKGRIIIGMMRSQQERHGLKTLNSYLRDIEIVTYDDLLVQARNFVDMLTAKPHPSTR